MKINPLVKLGNVPVQTGTIAACFDQLLSPSEKIRALEKDGQLIRLKRGLYVVSSEVSGKPVNACLCANHIYGPSYVGREYALRFYGLIPERVYLVTSVTTKHSREFDNAVGSFDYQNCQSDYFHIGIRMEQADGVNFLIASPEKALCDVINFSKSLFLRSMKDVEIYLEEDIRFDTDALIDFDIEVLEKCAPVSRKQSSINTLIKYIKHVRHF